MVLFFCAKIVSKFLLSICSRTCSNRWMLALDECNICAIYCFYDSFVRFLHKFYLRRFVKWCSDFLYVTFLFWVLCIFLRIVDLVISLYNWYSVVVFLFLKILVKGFFLALFVHRLVLSDVVLDIYLSIHVSFGSNQPLKTAYCII